MLAAMLAFLPGRAIAELSNEFDADGRRGNAVAIYRDRLGWLRRSRVAQGQASANSVFAPSIVASSIGAKLCGRSGGVEAMVTRP